jgi:peptidylprolyl isomerase
MADKKAKKASEKRPGTVKKEVGKSISDGSKVKIHYVGSFDDGKVFDASERLGEPLEFVVGSGTVIPGFEKAVKGMSVGDKKSVKIEAKEAYGEHRADLVKIITRDKLPADKEPKAGMVIVLGLSNGMEIPALITKVNGDMITIDLNHPLSGKNLNFQIEIVEVN